jgi:putative membrane protein
MFGGPWAGGGFGIFGLIFMLVFWVLIIASIVLVVKWLVEQGRSGGTRGSGGEAALDILKNRYARGEIGKEEFEAKKKDLLWALACTGEGFVGKPHLAKGDWDAQAIHVFPVGAPLCRAACGHGGAPGRRGAG